MITIEELLRRPDPILRMPRTDELHLLEIHLPPGEVSPPDISFPQWTGNDWKVDAAGYDGVRLIGNPSGTTLVPHNRDATMTCGPQAGAVVIENVKMLPGSRYAILFENKTDEKHCLLRLRRVELLRLTPTQDRTRSSKWSFLHYGVDRDFEDCTFDGHYNSEHIDYGHGCSRIGSRFVNCRFVSSAGEQLKNTWRPQEVPFYNQDAEYEFYVNHCSFADWHQDHSDVGGAAITFQGAGYHYMRVMNSVFRPKATAGRCKTIMVDDGLSTVRDEADNRTRAYDIDSGLPLGDAVDAGLKAAVNGLLAVYLCGSSGVGTDSLTDMVRCGTTYTEYADAWEHYVTLGVSLRFCGFFGPKTKIALQRLKWVDIQRCNTDAIKQFCENQLGWDTSEEPTVISHGNEKLGNTEVKLPGA